MSNHNNQNHNNSNDAQETAADLRVAVQFAVLQLCGESKTPHLTPRALAALSELTYQYATTCLAPDLDAFAQHAKRHKSVSEADVLLAVRKCPLELRQRVQEALADYRQEQQLNRDAGVLLNNNNNNNNNNKKKAPLKTGSTDLMPTTNDLRLSNSSDLSTSSSSSDGDDQCTTKNQKPKKAAPSSFFDNESSSSSSDDDLALRHAKVMRKGRTKNTNQQHQLQARNSSAQQPAKKPKTTRRTGLGFRLSGINSHNHDESDDDDNDNDNNYKDGNTDIMDVSRTQRAANLTAREKEVIANMSLDDSLPSQDDGDDEHEFA